MKYYLLRVLVVVCAISPSAYAQNLSPIMVISDQTKGKTADAKVNRCIAELPAHGGICDARGFGATRQTVAATIEVGTLEKMVTLLIDRATEFECTITSGDACVQLGGGSAIVASGETEALAGQHGGFILSNEATVSNVLRLADQVSGAGFAIENVVINTNPRSTVKDSVVNLTNPLQVGTVRGLTIGGYAKTVLLKITQTVGGSAGPINVYNPELDCGGLTGCQPLLIRAIKGGGSMGGLNFYGGTYVHPGLGANAIAEMRGVTGNEITGVNFYGPYLESWNESDVGFLITNSTGVLISSPFFSSHDRGGNDCVKISGVDTDGIIIQNLDNFNRWTNNIDNKVNGRVLTSSSGNRMALYVFNLSARSSTSVWDDADGNLATIDSNGLTLKSKPLVKFPKLSPNGTLIYCSDCIIKNPCKSGGTGALAKKINGVWVCN